MDSMSALDASFIYLENETNHMHIAVVAKFEGPPPEPGAIEAMIESKLAFVPRYRQKLLFVPFGLGRPVWTDDPNFDLAYHLRHTALPSPGSTQQLEILMGRIVSQKLDASRPLWEIWIVEGLSGGEWAMVSKTHHCMIDGVAGVDLMTSLLDTEPESEIAAPEEWKPEPRPSAWSLATHSLAESFANPKDGIALFRTVVGSPIRTLQRLSDFSEGLASYRKFTSPELEVSLNGPIGAHRRWRSAEVPLAEIAKIRSARGGTLNDVVLTAIALGFRSLLLSRGEPVRDRAVRSLVPISVRSEKEKGQLDNHVAAMFVDLPVGDMSPIDRLEAIRSATSDLKAHHAGDPAIALATIADHTPPALLALGTQVFARMDQHAVQTITTNVPGPTHTLYALGRRMIGAYPYVPIAGSVRIAIAIFSYAGQICFGFTGDYETAPDLDVLAEGVERGIKDLIEVS